ncbi:MAG TPA: S8 family serine peptidase [bacterium]|nr:S8 family serine peptidase [bacterium]HPA57838.1 S8 family serine peptidase [bacterium]HQM84284.1 S8 family serine peptidase [bacterium]HQN73890.1 S8 family serine peptidase [bacterium]
MLNKKFMIIFLAVFFSNILAALSTDCRIEEKFPVENSGDLNFRVSKDVQSFINLNNGKKETRMKVVLPIREIYKEDTEIFVHEADITDGNSISFVNGELVTDNEIDIMAEKKLAKIVKERSDRIDWRKYAAEEFIHRMSLKWSELEIQHDPEAAGVIAEFNVSQLQEVINNNTDLFLGIESQNYTDNSMASAMLDTNVDPYVLNYSSRQGDGVGIYQSENCCSDPGFISDYYKIAGNCVVQSHKTHAERVAGVLREASPLAFVYCRNGCAVPTSTDLNGYNGNPPIHIVNLSCGGGRTSAGYNTLSRDFDNHVYGDAVAVFAAAGNDAEEPAGENYVNYPAEGLNVVAVGAYNDANDTIATFSSGVNSTVGNEKPDISAPGVNISSGGHGNASGTSLSTPHAAAIGADFAGCYTWLKLKPHYLNALTLATSNDVISGSWWRIGVGGIDFRDGFFDGHAQSWEGSNGSWSTFDNNDPYPGNGKIDKVVSINSSFAQVHVAIWWLTRGDYTYAHQDDTYPLGMDLDVTVYDPNGNVVGSSASRLNPWESLRFDPTVTGNYRVSISRAYNRDTSCNIRLGLWINKDN